MNPEPTPEQRLALSRAQLAHALREPVWLALVQRWLQAQAATRQTGSER